MVLEFLLDNSLFKCSSLFNIFNLSIPHFLLHVCIIKSSWRHRKIHKMHCCLQVWQLFNKFAIVCEISIVLTN